MRIAAKAAGKEYQHQKAIVCGESILLIAKKKEKVKVRKRILSRIEQRDTYLLVWDEITVKIDDEKIFSAN